jgi:hypothetical protein
MVTRVHLSVEAEFANPHHRPQPGELIVQCFHHQTAQLDQRSRHHRYAKPMAILGSQLWQIGDRRVSRESTEIQQCHLCAVQEAEIDLFGDSWLFALGRMLATFHSFPSIDFREEVDPHEPLFLSDDCRASQSFSML